jgi:ABC-type multidrug transport system fused ATPase/permease subunit
MNELFRILKGFYNQNKSLVISSIFFQILYSIFETIVIPYILAGTFNNIKNSKEFKLNIIKLVACWIVIKLVGAISLYFHNQIEPQIAKYIVVTIVNSVFDKYEKENHITNISILIDKIHLIKTNLHDFSYLFCTVFIPRIIVLIVSCFNLFRINKKLGITIFICVIIQYFILSYGLSECVKVTYKECKNRDGMYDYIEDLFSNINTIQSTTNGFESEMKKIDNLTTKYRQSEMRTVKCISKKQYIGAGSNITIFSIILYTIYNLYKTDQITSDNATTSILLIIGLFDNMSDMAYYMPEFTYRVGILLSNNDFLKTLILDNYKDRANLSMLNVYDIQFKNVSFLYPNTSKNILKDFNLEIPKNKIISIYGNSGSGKTTFIKLIFGIENPTSGKVTIGGKNIKDYDIKDIRKYIAFVDQNTSNLFNRSIFENIIYGNNYSEKNKLKHKQEIKNIFLKYNLYNIFKSLDKDKSKWSFLDQNVGKLGNKLSGGQKKIIHLLRISLNDIAKIVILDEPSNGLDENTRNSVIEYITNMKMNGKTVLIISHDPHFKGISDKILQFSTEENPKYIL